MHTPLQIPRATSEYFFVFDGHDIAPKIEGPKFYKKGKYFYILAPAGGVGTGWQVALRSENIYGPYESKIILLQGDSPVNGPHQGALIDLDDFGEKWAFMHFQDAGAYGRIVHLQPAVWDDGWVYCGKYEGDKIAGTPVEYGEYPVNIPSGYSIDPSDEFDGEKLSPVWQTPANRGENWYSLKRGLKLNCINYGKQSLSDVPQLFLQKVNYFNFSIKCKCKLNLSEDGDEAGFVMFGRKYVYVCVVRRDGCNYLEIREGSIGGETDETIARSQIYEDNYVTFSLSAKRENPNVLTYKLSFGGSAFTHKFIASKGVWTGAKVGVYARSLAENSKGCALFKYFRVTCTDNRISSKN